MKIYWMKKDFRLLDNAALKLALNNECMLIAIFEPSISHHYDFDIRHWRFIYQSIQDLKSKGLKINIFYGEARNIFERLFEEFQIDEIISHAETGNDLTYARDLDLIEYFKNKHIKWTEFQTNAVVRGLKHRDGWDALWIKYVKAPQIDLIRDFDKQYLNEELSLEYAIPPYLLEELKNQPEYMLQGGEEKAHEMLQEFLNEKIENYWGSISYPEKSRYFCSMLSAYITYGNLSIRQIYQACEGVKKQVRNKVSLEQYMARLKWHCHFVQKLELEPSIEYKNLNSAFDNIREKKNKKYIKAWKAGMTGYPLIDAAMRCVAETGYLNFRLRSTVVSFLTHLLWQPWQAGVGHLARQFLDYEPGIHFAQFQMQAGTTGINTIRIYNPIKQSKEKDQEGVFIKRWVPELKNIPKEFIHEPWKMTEMDQLMYEFKLGRDYPKPIIDFEKEHKNAREKLWKIKNSDKNKYHAKRILKKHAAKNRRES